MSLRLGDRNETVRRWRQVMAAMFKGYARVLGPLPTDTDEFGLRAVAWQQEYERRTFQAVDGIVSDQDLIALGIQTRTLPLFFTVEGHLSDMFRGPVADTATQLEGEGLCRHQPVGYNNGTLPFDNASGVAELASLVGAFSMPNGVPFPAGTKWMLGNFSQGNIVAFDFYTTYLLPGQPLHWRLADLAGVLSYGTPCRETGSVAPWARAWTVGAEGTHGLDPKRRFGLEGFPKTPDNWVDVWRKGDIFAQNGDDESSAMKAAVYQAVARGDFFSNPWSLAAKIGDLFEKPASSVISIVMAIISGVGFLGTGGNNPHYSPFDIEGGVQWARERLAAT